MKPPCSSSMKAPVMPAASKALSISSFAGVQSWVLRPPSATSRATAPRATERVDCTIIWVSYRSAYPHMIWRASSPGRVCSMALVPVSLASVIVSHFPCGGGGSIGAQAEGTGLQKAQVN